MCRDPDQAERQRRRHPQGGIHAQDAPDAERRHRSALQRERDDESAEHEEHADGGSTWIDVEVVLRPDIEVVGEAGR